MTPEPHTPQEAPDPSKIDPSGLKDAHGRTGQILKQAGLPFDEDEFDGASARDAEAAAGADSSAARGSDDSADADDDSTSSSDEPSSSSSSEEE